MIALLFHYFNCEITSYIYQTKKNGMKKLSIHLVYLIVLNVILLKSLFAQVQQGHINQNKFRQLYNEFAEPNKYHNASGAPGVEYFQQKVDYVMDIESVSYTHLTLPTKRIV